MAGRFVLSRKFHAHSLHIVPSPGPNIDIIKSTKPVSGLVASEPGGSMTMVNKYGYVELQNGSRLEILKASERKMHYPGRFRRRRQAVGGAGQDITFFVNKQKKNEKFIVSTADYHIEVVGTYFKLQPDLKGHVAISVKEGQVKVVFESGDVKILKAGEKPRLRHELQQLLFHERRGQLLSAGT